jgi:hypothetical protein
MALRLIETTVLETTVRLRYADDAAVPTEWLDFQVKNENLKLPSGEVLSDRDFRPLAALQLAALRYALTSIDAEIARIRDQQVRIA